MDRCWGGQAAVIYQLDDAKRSVKCGRQSYSVGHSVALPILHSPSPHHRLPIIQRSLARPGQSGVTSWRGVLPPLAACTAAHWDRWTQSQTQSNWKSDGQRLVKTPRATTAFMLDTAPPPLPALLPHCLIYVRTAGAPTLLLPISK